MKQVIVEGPDGAGKSTLIATLRAGYPELNPFPPYKNVPEMDYETYMGFAVSDTAGPIGPKIHDRLFYSELVYGPLLRGKIALRPERVRYYRSLLGDTAFLIYCRLPYEELVKCATASEQKEGVLENLHLIYRDYDTIIGDSSARYWTRNAYAMYDQTPDALGKVMHLVGAYLRG